MKLSDFDFHLPESCIATAPCEPRDACKLLQVSKFFFDFTFHQLPDLLNPGDIVVFNNSKVIPARLFGTRGELSVELLLHKPLVAAQTADPTTMLWTAFAKPGKRLKCGNVISFDDVMQAEVIEKRDNGEIEICLHTLDNRSVYEVLEDIGHMPLPPYIKRADTTADRDQYQTVYAQTPGSVAAPTAGLHFTPELLQQLAQKNIHTAYITLHVGAGTFQPVKVEDTDEHIMHSEWAEISADTAEAINAARAAGGKVIAVGTTALRILETVAADDGTLRAFSGDTDIFITPGYRFKIVERLITNFHLPKSTLFMLVSAFSGLARMHAAYAHAMQNNYRFYSYGDACLLDRLP